MVAVISGERCNQLMEVSVMTWEVNKAEHRCFTLAARWLYVYRYVGGRRGPFDVSFASVFGPKYGIPNRCLSMRIHARPPSEAYPYPYWKQSISHTDTINTRDSPCRFLAPLRLCM